MKRVLFSTVLLCASSIVFAGVIDPGVIYRRGDANHDQQVDNSDVAFLYNFLFQSSSPAPPCRNEADVNHDGSINVSDPVYLSNWLFQGGPIPPAPGPHNTVCTISDDPVISCDAGCP